MKEKLEVLAPAGDLTILEAAVMAGADAVYFGGESFGARAYASNFSLKDAVKGIKFAHARGARTYLTVNTLLKSLEIEKHVYEYLKDYYNAGIDAVLVQDIGLMQLIRTYFPGLRLHISTQANVTSEYGAAFFKKMGASRVVLARELSLKEIKLIHDSVDIELECFAHGALCVSYSGQCLMSSMIGGRSGNRGRCAQPCRKCYDLYESSYHKRSLPGRYPISMKDLCTIDDVKALYDAGCTSLKIEGRMKSKEYVTKVVSSYRKAADLAMEGKRPEASLKKTVLTAGTREGGTDKYLYARNGADMMSFSDSSFSSDTPTAVFPGTKSIRARAVCKAVIGERLAISIIGDDGRTVTKKGAVVEPARSPKDITQEIQDKIKKTGDDRIAITEVTVNADANAFVPVSQIKSLRREAVYEFLGGIKQERPEPVPFEPVREKKHYRQTADKIIVTCMTYDQVCAASEELPDDSIIAIDYDLFARMGKADIPQQMYLCLPEILRSDMLPDIDLSIFDGFIISSYDEIEYVRVNYPDKPLVFDSRLYAWSDRSREALMSSGAKYISAPIELNAKELGHLDNESSFICVYGRTPVMYMAACSHKNSAGCDKVREVLYLRDERKVDFPVMNLCSICTNVVYNSLPTSLLPYTAKIKGMGFAGYRFDFTIEDTGEVREVLAAFKNNMTTGSQADITSESTRGHFHRGVS